MPSSPIGVPDTATGTNIAEVSTVLLPDALIVTTTTADPGSGGTSLAVTLRDRFPQTTPFYIRVENETMQVTGGTGTGAGSFTVTRGVLGSTAVAHTTGSVVSQLVATQRVVTAQERFTTFEGSVASFRTLGSAATPQNIFSIENAASSQVVVGVRLMMLESDATVVLTAVMPQFNVTRPTALPTGGTTLTKVATDTAGASNSSVVLRGATASDGGAATAITATAGSRLWHQFVMRLHTAVGQVLSDSNPLIPEGCWWDPFVLRAGEALLVQVVGTAASNAATNHYIVKCRWTEFRLP